MKINNTPTSDALKAYNSQTLQGVYKYKDPAAASKSLGAPSADTVNISSTVKLMKDIAKAVSDAPDIRMDKVNDIKSKIETGEYKPDLNVVADKLMSPNISDRI
jgi:negative regulator of flagellin synthesis FlgM